jgi:outer membrane protein
MKNQVVSTKYQVIGGILFCIVSLFGSEGFSQTARDTGRYFFSLPQAIDFAAKNQTQMLNAGYDEQAAKQKVKETIGIGLPQISGSFDVKDFLEIPTSVIPAQAFNPFASPDEFNAVQFGTKYNATAGVDASQLVFSSEYLIGLQATKTFLELTRKATQRTKIELTVTVTKAYYSVLLNDERMKLIESNVARLKKLMEDTKALNANGFVEKTDLDRVTVAYNNLLVEKEKISRLMELGNNLLKFQMGMDQQAKLTLSDKLEDVKIILDASADKFDYGKRVEYSLMQTQKDISQLQLKRFKMGYLPNMALYGSANANAYRNKFDIFNTRKSWYPMIVVGARIGVTLFDGLQNQHRIQQSKLDILKAENNMKMVQQSIDLEVASAKANLQNAAVSLDLQKKNIELAEGIYKSSKLKYEQGVGSNLEVMSAETGLKEAQTNYFTALYDALISKVDYDKANGNIK